MSALAIVPEQQQQQSDVLQTAKQIVIASPRAFENAAEFLKGIKDLQDAALAKFEPMREKAFSSYQEVLTQKKIVMEPLAQAEMVVKSTMARYQSEQRRIAFEREAELRAQAIREQEAALEAQLEAAEAEGASPEQVQAIIHEPVFVPAPRVETAAPIVSGISSRETWKAHVVSIKDLARAVADGKQPETLLTANQVALDGIARAMKGGMNIPGCRPVKSEGIAVRRGR